MNAARRFLALAEAGSIEATGRRDPEWMSAYLAQVAAAMMSGVSAGYLRLGAVVARGGPRRGRNPFRSPGPPRPPGPPGPPGLPRSSGRSGPPRSWPTGRRRHGD